MEIRTTVGGGQVEKGWKKKKANRRLEWSQIHNKYDRWINSNSHLDTNVGKNNNKLNSLNHLETRLRTRPEHAKQLGATQHSNTRILSKTISRLHNFKISFS